MAECPAMQTAFNGRWAARYIGASGLRASCGGNARTAIVEDRDALRMEVNERRRRLLQKEVREDLAERLAIEQALIARGYLRIENRGRR